MSLQAYREHTAEAVRRLRACGDEHVHLFSGLDLLGEADVSYLPDQLHPNGDGYELIGRRAAETILPALLADRP
jgi:lysophospholipase L1-like esterase